MCISTLAQLRPPSASPHLLDYSLQVYLHTRTITASKCIATLAWSQPPSASPHSRNHGLRVHLPTRSIAVSNCISKLARSRPRSVSLSSLDHGVVEGRQPIIKPPPHLTWDLNGILEKGRFWFEEHRKRVRGFERIPGHDEPHKLRGSMNAWQECVRNHKNCVDLWKLGKSVWDQKLGKIECGFHIMRWLSTPGSPRYILSVAESISILHVSPLSMYLRYPCISVRIYIERLRQYLPYYDVVNLVAVTKMNLINEMPSEP